MMMSCSFSCASLAVALLACSRAGAVGIESVDLYSMDVGYYNPEGGPLCADLRDATAIFLPLGVSPADVTFVAEPDTSKSGTVRLKLSCDAGSSYESTESSVPYAYSGDRKGTFVEYGSPTWWTRVPAPALGACRLRVTTVMGSTVVEAVDLDLRLEASASATKVSCCVPACPTCGCAAPTPEPTTKPTAPNSSPSAGAPAAARRGIDQILLTEDGQPLRPLNLGHKHLLWRQDAPFEKEGRFHEKKENNIAVRVGAGVSRLEVEGYFFRLAHPLNTSFATVDYGEPLLIYKKTYVNTVPSKLYNFLDGTEDRTRRPTQVRAERRAPGKILLEAGHFFLKATARDAAGEVVGKVADFDVMIYANPQRQPVFDGETIVVEKWKNIYDWQRVLRTTARAADPNFVSPRPQYDAKSVAQVTFFENFIYLVHSFWGVVFKVDDADDSGPDAGMSLFLDMKGILEARGTSLGIGGAQSGLRSVAFHPLGDSRRGRVYCSLTVPTPKDKQSLIAKGYYIQPRSGPTLNEDNLLVEFQYRNGKVDAASYRVLFYSENVEYNHLIKEVTFGVDKPETSLDESQLLYVAQGDGYTWNPVRVAQADDALGKILRIDPLDGTGDLDADLEDLQYAADMNPFSKGGAPGVRFPIADVAAPKFNGVPPETFSLGHRNPHSMAFAKDGTFIVAETGSATFEEVNIIEEGDNYGWSHFEGHYKYIQGPLLYGSVPQTDADYCPRCDFRFPVVQVGRTHSYEGGGSSQFAMAGGHVLENGSPLAKSGAKFFYFDFPRYGETWYSFLDDLKAAQNFTKGKVSSLRTAPIYKAYFKLKDQGNNDEKISFFREIAIDNFEDRLDLRLGKDRAGTLYFSSKISGDIYRVTNSMP